jgi:aldehyde:ferredoxin oxidoreductase
MVGGYTGRMLIIDLTNKKTSIIKTDIKAAEKFIGAKGLGAKLLYDMLPD